jgi:hypothetical protein
MWFLLFTEGRTPKFPLLQQIMDFKIYRHTGDTFTIYTLQSCELSTPQSRHVCSKLSEATAGFGDTPETVLSVSRERERGKGETQDSVYREIVHF